MPLFEKILTAIHFTDNHCFFVSHDLHIAIAVKGTTNKVMSRWLLFIHKLKWLKSLYLKDMINQPIFNYSTEVINENDRETFKRAVTELVNKGYVLASSGTTFDSNGTQWFYALLFFSNKTERVPLGFSIG